MGGWVGGYWKTTARPPWEWVILNGFEENFPHFLPLGEVGQQVGDPPQPPPPPSPTRGAGTSLGPWPVSDIWMGGSLNPPPPSCDLCPHVRPSPSGGRARTADRQGLKGASLAECSRNHRPNRRQLTWYSGGGRKGPGPYPQPWSFRTADTENAFWNTELRVIKTVGAGTVGPNCGEANPDLPLASASSDMIRWSRVLLSHTVDAARSYRVLVVRGAGITK